MMELLSPAGSLEKLRIAYRYGADAAYVGIQGFSLRSAADTIIARNEEAIPDRGEELRRLKQLDGRPRKLYGALNMFAHERDLQELPRTLETIKSLPLDALIVADVGLVEPIRSVLPDIELHLSTQANCTNKYAAKLYHQLGFSRIVAARELTLDEIRTIHDAVPELEIEVFVHGAMCMSYSGRCFLSTAMIDRSANRGDCAHSCRWNYAIVEEKRPGEYYPIEEDGRFSTILSSRDLMLYDRVPELVDAGITALKIEGRMKSSLYAAVVTGAYRAALDRIDRSMAERESNDTWRSLLFALSHREYTQGFLFQDRSVHTPSHGVGPTALRLMGVLGPAVGDDRSRWTLEAKNAIYSESEIALITPKGMYYPGPRFELSDVAGNIVHRVVHREEGFIRFLEIDENDLTDALLTQSIYKNVDTDPRRSLIA